MRHTQIYIVWKSHKGCKDLWAVFKDKKTAEHNANIWQKESDSIGGMKENFRVTSETMWYEY